MYGSVTVREIKKKTPAMVPFNTAHVISCPLRWQQTKFLFFVFAIWRLQPRVRSTEIAAKQILHVAIAHASFVGEMGADRKRPSLFVLKSPPYLRWRAQDRRPRADKQSANSRLQGQILRLISRLAAAR